MNKVKLEKSKKMSKPFNITSVCREDIVMAGFNKKIAEAIEDDEMEYIARKMADVYCETGFWDALQECVENIITQKKQKK